MRRSASDTANLETMRRDCSSDAAAASPPTAMSRVSSPAPEEDGASCVCRSMAATVRTSSASIFPAKSLAWLVVLTVAFLHQPQASVAMSVRGVAAVRRIQDLANDDQDNFVDVFHSPSKAIGLDSASRDFPSGLAALLKAPSSPMSVLLPSSRHQRRRSLRRSPRTADACYNQDRPMSVYLKRSRVCQNCQKITRASGAYDECCNDVDHAYNWCRRIYDFTSAMG